MFLNLEKYNEQFIAELNKALAIYTTIGSSTAESPMWFQYKTIEDMCFVFASSQRSAIKFEIYLDETDRYNEDIIRDFYDEVYNHFKALKYSYIKEKWPTVYYELRPEEKPVVLIEDQGTEFDEKINVEKKEEKETEYDIQAKKFLLDTKTELTTKFLKFDKHFQDDSHPRNIFEVTLKNSKHEYKLNFGSSLRDSLENCNDILYEDTMDFFYGLKFEGLKTKYLTYSQKFKIKDVKEAWNKEGSALEKMLSTPKIIAAYSSFVDSNTSKYNSVKLGFNARDFVEKVKASFIKKCSELAKKNFGEAKQATSILHPKAYDILACITKYEAGTFEDFCSNYGYDEDSRKAYKVYESVKEEWENVQKLFTPEEIEQLQEIQ